MGPWMKPSRLSWRVPECDSGGVLTFKIRQQTGHASDAMLLRYIRDFLGNATGFLL
jgi:hypothetical protein